MRKTLSGVCRYCKLASSSKDTKQPLKFQRVFLCYMAQSKKSHYKENIVKKMKMTLFSFNFIMTLKADLDPLYLIQTIFILVSIVKAVSQKCKQ